MNRQRINIAGLDEDSVDRLRADNPDAEFYVEHPGGVGATRSNLREMPQPEPEQAAIEQVEQLEPCEATPGCIGKVGHEGDCVIETPDSKPGE